MNQCGKKERKHRGGVLPSLTPPTDRQARKADIPRCADENVGAVTKSVLLESDSVGLVARLRKSIMTPTRKVKFAN